jgi:hypothetical protein
VGGDADGLVDDDEVVVVVDDRQALDPLGHGGGGPRGVGDLDLEPGPGGEAVGLADHPAVDDHAARGGDLRGPGAGEAQQAREGRVDAFALEAVGDGQAALLRHPRPPAHP